MSEEYTDEQLAAAFPGQDVASLRASLDKSAGKGTEVSPNADTLPSDEGKPEAAAPVEYPDYIPEKFRQGTVEEATARLAKSYGELEKARSGAQAKPQANSEPAPEAADADAAPAATITMDDVVSEFLKNDRTISDETYKAFEEKGVARDFLNNYVLGQEAISNQLISQVYSEVGGAEEYGTLMEWATANLTEAEIDAYDNIMASGSIEAVKMAVGGLQARRGTAPSLLKGTGEQTASHPGYESRAEMTRDMRDPRYKTDAAFRKQVENKLANSNIW
jgi:hypothetical protein